MGPMTDLQTIIDRHAAATPGPHHVDVIDDHSGRPEGKNWVISGLARERYGNNSVSFGEDEKTARFVAAVFTDVPAMAAALQRAEAHLATMDSIWASGRVTADYFKDATEELRKALTLEDEQ